MKRKKASPLFQGRLSGLNDNELKIRGEKEKNEPHQFEIKEVGNDNVN
jgi:hypothetical protein